MILRIVKLLIRRLIITFIAILQIIFQVSKLFENAVKELPTNPNDTLKYKKLIETFGTHYTNKIVMGAKAVIQSQVSFVQ